MIKILITFLLLIQIPLLQAKSELKRKRFTLRPYLCVFNPSKKLKQAVAHATGKNTLSALAVYKEDALAEVVSRCAAAAERFELDSSECFEIHRPPDVLLSHLEGTF